MRSCRVRVTIGLLFSESANLTQICTGFKTPAMNCNLCGAATEGIEDETGATSCICPQCQEDRDGDAVVADRRKLHHKRAEAEKKKPAPPVE